MQEGLLDTFFVTVNHMALSILKHLSMRKEKEKLIKLCNFAKKVFNGMENTVLFGSNTLDSMKRQVADIS